MRRTSDVPKKQPLSAAERRERGRELREQVPREKHAEWKVPKGRRPVLEMLADTDEGRISELLPIRYGRMVESAFGFAAREAVTAYREQMAEYSRMKVLDAYADQAERDHRKLIDAVRSGKIRTLSEAA